MAPVVALVVLRSFFVATGPSVLSLTLTSLANPLLLRSMGGLLAADAVYEFIHTRPDVNAPLWPNIIACLAFDTPVWTHPFSD
jgi:hypothetical protein